MQQESTPTARFERDGASTARLVELDDERRVALDGLGRPEHDRYMVTEKNDGTLVLSPAPGCTEHDLALMARPDILRLLELERDRFIGVPIHTTPESAPIELANLAVRQSRRTVGAGEEQVAIPHPRFEEAVAAARAEPDEDKAFEVAKQILDDEDAWAVFQRPV